MPVAKSDTLVKSVQAMLTEKQAVAKRERALIVRLNSVLNRMGYEIVARNEVGGGRRGHRAGGQAVASLSGSRPRRRMSAAARRAVSRRMKAYWAKRKAGKSGAKRSGKPSSRPAGKS